MDIRQHLLGHTNSRLGWFFSQQDIEAMEVICLEADVTVTPCLEADVCCSSSEDN